MVYETPGYVVVSVQAETPPELPYGVQMIGAPLEWSETRGAGVKVAVIDTGKPNHPDIKIAGAVSFSGVPVDDIRGHGTHVAGIIAANGKIKGVAPEVELHCLQVSSLSGGLSPEAIAKALWWCKDNKIDIVNMSLGGPSPDSNIEAACKACYEAGIVLVGSAGNFGPDFGVLYPARYLTVIATAAVDIEKKRAPWSSKGKEVEVAAAGVQIWSTWLDGKYALLEGTSMAAPHITGAVALLQAKAKLRFGKKLTPDQIRLLLQMYSEDLGIRGPDEEYGYGVFSFGRFGQSDMVKKTIEMWIGKKRYIVNGQQKEMDVVPFIKDGRTFVPVRFVGESLDCKVEWVSREQKVIIKEV